MDRYHTESPWRYRNRSALLALGASVKVISLKGVFRSTWRDCTIKLFLHPLTHFPLFLSPPRRKDNDAGRCFCSAMPVAVNSGSRPGNGNGRTLRRRAHRRVDNALCVHASLVDPFLGSEDYAACQGTPPQNSRPQQTEK